MKWVRKLPVGFCEIVVNVHDDNFGTLVCRFNDDIFVVFEVADGLLLSRG